MVPLRSVISSVLMFSLLPTLFHGPLRLIVRAETLSYIGSAHGASWWLWCRVWFDHQNLRDERSEAFTSLLWGGVYNYSYVARATTPGLFIVPPARAEEMYHPESFGRRKSDRVRVE